MYGSVTKQGDITKEKHLDSDDFKWNYLRNKRHVWKLSNKWMTLGQQEEITKGRAASLLRNFSVYLQNRVHI